MALNTARFLYAGIFCPQIKKRGIQMADSKKDDDKKKKDKKAAKPAPIITSSGAVVTDPEEIRARTQRPKWADDSTAE